MEPFGRQQWKAFAQIVPDHAPENRQRPGAGAITLAGAVKQDVVEKAEILLVHSTVADLV